MAETITITDDRTGKSVTVPISDGVFPASAIRELDANLFVYDPAYMQTAACKSAITYLDGNAGILRYRGLPDRATGRAIDVPRGRVPAAEGRAARQGAARAVDVRRHAPHVHPREHAQAVRRRIPLRRPPDGHVRVGRGRARDLLQRRQGDLRRGEPREADPAADRQDADDRRHVPPLLGRAAVQLPRATACRTRATSCR